MAVSPPFDDRDGVIWYDGELAPWREANLHVLSHALHYIYRGQNHAADYKEDNDNRHAGPLGMENICEQPQEKRTQKGGEFAGKGKKTEKLALPVLGGHSAQQ